MGHIYMMDTSHFSSQWEKHNMLLGSYSVIFVKVYDSREEARKVWPFSNQEGHVKFKTAFLNGI